MTPEIYPEIPVELAEKMRKRMRTCPHMHRLAQMISAGCAPAEAYAKVALHLSEALDDTQARLVIDRINRSLPPPLVMPRRNK